MSLHTRQVLHHSADRVEGWFNQPGALRRLTPGLIPLTPVREATSLRDGVTEFALPGPLRWVARHDPAGYADGGRRFTDRVANQPFALLTRWRHEHRIDPVASEDGTAWSAVDDHVHTTVPGFLLKPMFAFRHGTLADDLGAADRLAGYLRTGDGPDAAVTLPRVTVAITGSSGTVGTQLCALLSTTGHRVIRLVRHSRSLADDERRWNPDAPDLDLLAGVDVLIHLAGKSIAGRFSDAHLRGVRGSRVGPSRNLARLVADSGVPVVVSASAVGYYGADRGTEVLDESAACGEGLLADIVGDWEAAWDEARAAGARVTVVRTGLVQSGGGGLLPMLSGVVCAGIGGRLGSGTHWFPWIALDDLLDIYHRAALDPAMSGPVNAVAPGGMTNADYTRSLGRVLHRPTVLPVPELGPEILLGKRGAAELALADQRAIPAALNALGHQFRYSRLESALEHELLKETLHG